MTDKLRARSYTDPSSDFFRNIFLSTDKINTDTEFNRPLAGRKGLCFEVLLRFVFLKF